jgi:hypothetical protein
MYKFNVGQKVIIKNSVDCYGVQNGDRGLVIDRSECLIDRSDYLKNIGRSELVIMFRYKVNHLNGTYWILEENLEGINEANASQNKNMNIKEKFALALTKEPQKSFRKLGITNGDDMLTDDGVKVFMSWLLNSKFAEEFKKDVVDDMLKELEEEKK